MPTPQTVVRGNDTSTAAYALAPGVFQYIESVFIEVDTSGSGAVQPTLEVQTQDGVVMATKQQGRAIDGGTAGRATWALRLDDELDTAIRPAVTFVFESTAVAPNNAHAEMTFLGWTPTTPHYSNRFFLTLPIIGAVGTVIRISYFNAGPDLVTLGFDKIVLTNFTTGQTETIDSTTVSAPTETGDLVSWDNHASGAVLLDRTFPKQPKFAVAGNYVITANGFVNQV